MRRRFATYLLLLTSIVMLAVPLVPHHHHANGQLCLKHDLPDKTVAGEDKGCCSGKTGIGCRQTSHNHEEDTRLTVNDRHTHDGHCCCDTGCLAGKQLKQAPETNRHDTSAGTGFQILLFAQPHSDDLWELAESTSGHSASDIGAVWPDAGIGTSVILRAPPSC